MKKTALALFTTLLLLSTACSSQATVETGAASDTTEPSNATVEETTADPTPAPTAEPTQVEAEPASNTTSAIGSDDWCTVASQVENSFDELDFFADTDSLEDAFTRSTAMINQAVEIAPPAIARDVAAMAEASTAMIEMLEQADWDFMTVDFDAFEERTAGMEQAGYNIEKYNFEVCGVGQDPDDLSFTVEDEIDLDELLDSDLVRDVMADTLAGFGIEEAAAACVVDHWSTNGNLDDPTAMMEAMTACDVPLSAMMGG